MIINNTIAHTYTHTKTKHKKSTPYKIKTRQKLCEILDRVRASKQKIKGEIKNSKLSSPKIVRGKNLPSVLIFHFFLIFFFTCTGKTLNASL